ncbi:MAG: GH3 auxin-responsive promoter family protein, partial [Actinomycetota bacterium]
VLDAVEQAQASLGLALRFFVMLADEAGARYRLYVEDSPISNRAVSNQAVPDRAVSNQAVVNQAGAEWADPTQARSARVAALAAAVDEALAETNIEYGSKRASGRLGPVVGLELVPGAAEAYRSACVADGQRDAQFKYLHLQYLDDLVGGADFSFDDHLTATDGRTQP